MDYLLLGAEKVPWISLYPTFANSLSFLEAQDNTIKDFVFDPQEFEWTEENLTQLAIAAAPDTEFAAISSDAKNREVFFQSPSGDIQSIYTNDDGETWELSDNLPETNPAAGGASLCSLNVGGKFHIFYAHQSHSVHVLISDGDTWRDELVPASTLEAPISSIYAKLDSSSFMLQFCDPYENVYLVSEGKSVKLGKIINGRVKVDKDAQSDRFPQPIKSRPKAKGASN